MRLVLLGCPGAGKGTQAKLITQTYPIPQISTGDILRQAIKKNNELGKKVKAIVESGQLVPDALMIDLVKERLQQPDCQSGFLLDGFPRTVAQAQALEAMTPIDYVIDIYVPQEEIVKRLSGRRIHPASGRIYHTLYHPPTIKDHDDVTGEPLIQRPDDEENTVRERLSIYQAQTAPLQTYYQHQTMPRYFKIDGTQAVADITKEIISILNNKIPSF